MIDEDRVFLPKVSAILNHQKLNLNNIRLRLSVLKHVIQNLHVKRDRNPHLINTQKNYLKKPKNIHLQKKCKKVMNHIYTN
jgi:hypothetical protein